MMPILLLSFIIIVLPAIEAHAVFHPGPVKGSALATLASMAPYLCRYVYYDITFRRWGGYGWKSSSSSNCSIRVVRVVFIYEFRAPRWPPWPPWRRIFC